LAAHERQSLRVAEAPISTRAFAMVTGTIGLLAVGALMLTVTPRRTDSPTAVASTTTPLAGLVATSSRVAPTSARQGLVTVVRLATAIGDGHQAVMTLADRTDPDGLVDGSEFDVQLTSGPMVTAVVDSTLGDLAMLTIRSSQPGHSVAHSMPAPDEIVTVLADPPVTIAFSDLASVEAGEGTPVFDLDGDLIGLCTLGADDQLTIVAVTEQPVTETSTPVTATSVAATSVAPSTSP
jgi:hypothetical protein